MLQLIAENKGNQPFTYRGALHSDLNISTPKAVNISGLNENFNNSLKNRELVEGNTTLQVNQAIDAIYQKRTATFFCAINNFNAPLA